MTDQPLPIRCRRIGFLVADLGRLLRRSFELRAGHLGLTQAQWRALALLARHEGINQATLAEMLEIQPITVTRLLDRMEQNGWIERRPDPADRRAVRLHLTPRAEPLLAELQAVGGEILELALAEIEPSQRLALVDSLEQMKTNLLHVAEPADAPRTQIDG